MPPFSYGAVPGRRREQAVLAIRCVTWRLAQAGNWVFTQFKDATNAFGALDIEELVADNEDLVIDEKPFTYI